MKTIYLNNAAELARKHPKTFGRPSGKDIAKLKAGHYAKVCAPFGDCNGERFWCLIKSRKGDVFKGVVRNDLLWTNQHGIKCDDKLTFHADNIYAVNFKL